MDNDQGTNRRRWEDTERMAEMGDNRGLVGRQVDISLLKMPLVGDVGGSC